VLTSVSEIDFCFEDMENKAETLFHYSTIPLFHWELSSAICKKRNSRVLADMLPVFCGGL
jgi:hypothetical protein